ncbi:MAG: hypothetical protein NVS9B6_05150 [Candidatus Limnocylindrales bacterium]
MGGEGARDGWGIPADGLPHADKASAATTVVDRRKRLIRKRRSDPLSGSQLRGVDAPTGTPGRGLERLRHVHEGRTALLQPTDLRAGRGDGIRPGNEVIQHLFLNVFEGLA